MPSRLLCERRHPRTEAGSDPTPDGPNRRRGRPLGGTLLGSLWAANDGGVACSDNWGTATGSYREGRGGLPHPEDRIRWRLRSYGLDGAQAYDLAQSPLVPETFACGFQDMGSWITQGAETWLPLHGADGGDTVFDPDDPYQFRSTTQGQIYDVQFAASMASTIWAMPGVPYGEHFHIVTALPDVFFGREAPLNRVPSVDLAPLAEDNVDPDQLQIGAKTALDLTWKEGLDAFTCTECGRCKDSCPTFLTGKPLSLKWVNDALKHHLVDEREHIRAGARDQLPALVGGPISDETLWACTTCGYCESACPIGIEHLSLGHLMRAHHVELQLAE